MTTVPLQGPQDERGGVATTVGSTTRDRRWIAMCALGAAGTAMTAATGNTTVRVVVLLTITAIAVGTIVLMLEVRKPERPAAWFAFAMGLGILVTATTVGALKWAGNSHAAVQVFLSIQVAGYLLVFGGFCAAAQIRRRNSDIDSTLDAMILGLAFGLFAWRTVFSGAVATTAVGPLQVFTVSLLPALDIVACTALLRRAFGTARTTVSYRLIMVAAAFATGAHIRSGISVLTESGLATHVPFQIGLATLLAAAALHPSMQSVTEPDEIVPHRFGTTRIALLALALLDTPLLILIDYGRSESSSAAFVIGACLMSTIVVIRLISLARQMEQSRIRERLREQRFESLVRNSSDLIAVLDTTYRITYLSPAVDDMLGFSAASVLGRNALDAFHPDDRATTKESLDALEPNTTSQLNLVRIRHRGGTWRWVEARAVNLTNDPTVEGIVINCRDVTERVSAEKLLFDTTTQQSAVATLGREALTAPDVHALATNATALVRNTLETESCTVILLDGSTITDAVTTTDRSSRVLLLHERPADRIITACTEAEDPTQFVDPDPGGVLRASTDLAFTALDDTHIRSGGDDDASNKRGDAHVLAVRLVDRHGVSGAMLVRSGEARCFTRSEAGFVAAMANTLGLALGRRRTEASARHQALHDELSGLPNRTLFVDRLTQAVARMERSTHRIAVLFLDIDQFKVINDSLGHSVGDRVICEIAGRLGQAIRPSDTVARFGGDEFTVLLEPLDDREEAADIAERIRAEASRPIDIGATGLQPTISVGVAVATDARANAETLLRDADAAMYQAKEDGRNNVAFFDDTMRARVIHRLRTEIDLPQAIAGDQLVLHFQPIIDLATGRIEGLEALVRWQHPELGLIAPGQFIPIAEQSGLIGELDHWVMRQVMSQCATLQSQLGPTSPWLSLNVSARTIATSDLPRLVAESLREAGVQPEKISVEITESALMNDVERSIGVLRALRDQGVALTVDDFGTGYSSLNYLKRLPVSGLKIDASFIAGLDHSGPDRAIVEAVVTLGATLEQQATAEGVETSRQLEVLMELGCPMAQGFLLGKPVPAAELYFGPQPVSALGVAHLDPSVADRS